MMHPLQIWLNAKTALILPLILITSNDSFADLSHLDLKGYSHDGTYIGLDQLVDHPGASPIFGYTTLKMTLENRRFFGNYGPKHPDFGCLESATHIHAHLATHHDCPQDATSEWIQRLFPSQDGVNFVANQIGTDPVSHLTPHVIGKVLEWIALVPDQVWVHDDHHNDLISDLSRILFEEMNPRKYHETTLATLRSELGKERKKGKRRSNEVTARLEQQIDEINAILGKSGSSLSGREDSPVSEESDESTRASPHSTLGTPLKEGIGKKKDYDQLAGILVNALKESRIPPNRYPKYLPEQALLAFFIKKSNDKQDLIPLFEGMPSLIKDHALLSSHERQEAFVRHRWTRSDFHPERFASNPSGAANEFSLHPEQLVFAIMEDKLYSKPLPPILSYGSAKHDSLTYPDCGETSLRNFFNILIYDPKTGKFDAELLNRLEAAHPGIHFHPHLREFYSRHSDPSEAASQSVRDNWSQHVVSNHGEVNYLRPREAPVCEMNAGVDNMLKLIYRLTGANTPGNRAQKMKTLCETLSREGSTLSWQVEGVKDQATSDARLNANNTGITLAFKINGTPSFAWDFSPGHFAVRDLSAAQPSWKDQVGEALAKRPESSTFLAWFANERTLDKLTTDHPSLREDLIYALPLSTHDAKLSAFKKIVLSKRDQAIALQSLAMKLRRQLPERDDLNTEQQIHAALADAGYPYVEESMKVDDHPNALHALGKPDAIYTRVSHEELAVKFGEPAATKMGLSWKREMYGHPIVIGEPLLKEDGSEFKAKFENAKLECLKLNGAPGSEKYETIKSAFNKREQQLDTIRKSRKTDKIKTQELAQVHTDHPIHGCYLMSKEEWQIPESDFGYKDQPRRFVPQILPKLHNRLFWSCSGNPDNAYIAFIFIGYDGSVYDGLRDDGESVRCGCGAAAW